MNWDWKKSFKLNGLKILGHNAIEYSWLGTWIYALENSTEAWIIGIAGAVTIHLILFSIIDIFHEKHTHK